MSKNKNIKKLVTERQEARDICKQILDHSNSDNLKVCIMFELAMNLEDRDAIKEITSVLKKFRENINNEENKDNNSKDKPKLIID